MQVYENCTNHKNSDAGAHKSGTWRLAVQNQRLTIPTPRKYEKQHFA